MNLFLKTTETKKSLNKKWLIVPLFITMGCTTPSNLTHGDGKTNPTFRAHIGVGSGGITENTDMTVIDNAAVDAFSGATKKGVHAGGRVILPLKRNAVESGLDFSFGNQSFTYLDGVHGYVGKRTLDVAQLSVPLMYSLGFLKKNAPLGIFQIKAGVLGQMNLIGVTDTWGTLPEYKISPFSVGAIFGVSVTPIRLKNNARIGFYLEGYRGSQAYDDFYNRKEFETPGTSFVRYGIIWQF
jgi:hypothetical protein